jgi:type IV secretion system protein VirD4
VSGIRLGYFQTANGLQALDYKGGSHAVAIGQTGCGKFTTLLAQVEACWDGSLFVIDPKGQQAAVVGPYLAEKGVEVSLLNSFNILPECFEGLEAVTYNPLMVIRESRFPATYCDKIGDGAFPVSDHETQPHFPESGQQLGTGLMLALACHSSAEENNLAVVRDLICSADEVLFGFCRRAVENTDNNFVRQKLSQFSYDGTDDGLKQLKENREIRSIISAARIQSKFIGNEVISAALRGEGTFRFKWLREKRRAVFCILPLSAIDVCHRWFRLMFASAMAELLDEDSLGKLPVLCVLDEAAQLGRLTVLENAIAMARGFGVQFLSVFTDVPQMERIYTQGAFRSFMANCGVQVLLAGNDSRTCSEISTMCGTTEVINYSHGVTHDPTGSISVNNGANQIKIPLLQPHQVRELPRDECLIWAEGTRGVIRAKRVPYFKLPEFRNFRPDPYEKGKNHGADEVRTPRNDNHNLESKIERWRRSQKGR